MRLPLLGVAVACLAVYGCAKDAPVNPVPSSSSLSPADAQMSARPNPGRPEYEEAYYDGQVVTINGIEVPQHVPEQAQADFYEVVYPIGWAALGLAPPQCNPCDHEGNGIDFTDYHDHILDSIPSDPGHGEYRVPWHVYVVLPAYTGDPAHDSDVSAAYASYLPVTREGDLDVLLAATLPNGDHIAAEIDPHFYFLCAVVDPHAAP